MLIDAAIAKLSPSASRMTCKRFAVPLTLAASIAAAPVAAIEFETHRIQGLLNLDLSYGATYRLDDADERLIAFANGGTVRTSMATTGS